MRNGIKRDLFVVFATLLELVWLYVMIRDLTGGYPWIPALIHTLVFILVLRIYGQHVNAAMEILWILLIAVAPPFGAPLYLLVGSSSATHHTRLHYEKVEDRLSPLMPR